VPLGDQKTKNHQNCDKQPTSNCPISTKDIVAAEAMFVPDIGALTGKNY